MERQFQQLINQLNDLSRDYQRTKMAANFLLNSIVEVLDAQSGEHKFSDALREKIETELAKITMGGTSIPKSAINELMAPPIKNQFSNIKPEPFLK